MSTSARRPDAKSRRRRRRCCREGGDRCRGLSTKVSTRLKWLCVTCVRSMPEPSGQIHVPPLELQLIWLSSRCGSHDLRAATCMSECMPWPQDHLRSPPAGASWRCGTAAATAPQAPAVRLPTACKHGRRGCAAMRRPNSPPLKLPAMRQNPRRQSHAIRQRAGRPSRCCCRRSPSQGCRRLCRRTCAGSSPSGLPAARRAAARTASCRRRPPRGLSARRRHGRSGAAVVARRRLRPFQRPCGKALFKFWPTAGVSLGWGCQRSEAMTRDNPETSTAVKSIGMRWHKVALAAACVTRRNVRCGGPLGSSLGRSSWRSGLHRMAAAHLPLARHSVRKPLTTGTATAAACNCKCFSYQVRQRRA